MWHLEKPSDKELDTYTSCLLPYIKKRINKQRANVDEKAWCDYLLPNDDADNLIKDILTSEPKKLLKLNNIHINNLLRAQQSQIDARDNNYTYSERQLRHYLKAKRKRKKNDRHVSLVERYERLFMFLIKVFDYGLVKGSIAYQIAQIKNINTCPYCNRSYTFAIGKDKLTSIIRPHFDHWFAHTHYPLLSLSFYNLIPSCSNCNSSVKGTNHYSLKTHIHPYLTTSYEPDFKFIPILKYDKESDSVKWGVMIKRDILSRENRMIIDLALDEIYDCHGELEVKDIMDFALKNNPTYLHDLFLSVCSKLQEEYKPEDVYRMMFGIEAEIDKTHVRPFSKLKRDILYGEGIRID